MPNVPTFAQAGYDVDCPTWLGLFAPKGVDPQIVKKLEAAFKAGAESPAFLETCDKLMFIPRYMDSATFTKYVKETFDKQEAILKELGWIQ